MKLNLEKISYQLHPYLRQNAVKVKVLSPPRSGSNWLEKLLYKNFNVVVQSPYEPCWKHDYPSIDIEVEKIILLREPFSWLVSFYDWERIHGRIDEGLSIFDFATGEIVHPDIVRYIGKTNPIEYWNKFLHQAIMRAGSDLLLSHDHLHASAERALNQISSQKNWAFRGKGYSDFTMRADWWRKPNIIAPMSGDKKREVLLEANAQVFGFDLVKWNIFNGLSLKQLASK